MQKITRFKDIPRFTDPGSYAVDYPFKHLIKFLDEEIQTQGLQMEPEFQRGHVWTEAQQIAFMEFILRGGTTGRDLYFNCPNWLSPTLPSAYNDYVCVDGLQRITAIRRFIQNEIKVFGSYYSEFEDSLRTIRDTMRVHINTLKTYSEVLIWYLEMNAGGTPHTAAELNRVKALLDHTISQDQTPHSKS